MRRLKKNTRLAFMYYPNGKEMGQMVRNDISCNCIPLERIAFLPRSHIHELDAGLATDTIPASFVAIRIGP